MARGASDESRYANPSDQMLFVIIAFSEHHVENLLHQMGKIPYAANPRNAYQKQKLAPSSAQGRMLNKTTSTLQTILGGIVTLMIFGFLLSLINSLAQRYHKRLCDKPKSRLRRLTYEDCQYMSLFFIIYGL
ncbi:hypothetical protein COOONC_23275 [Cooperia oncophora]